MLSLYIYIKGIESTKRKIVDTVVVHSSEQNLSNMMTIHNIENGRLLIQSPYATVKKKRKLYIYVPLTNLPCLKNIS